MPAVKSEPKMEDKLIEINQNLLKLTAEPEKFLLEQPEKCRDIENMLQNMYAVTIQSDRDQVGNPEILPELVVEDMDVEQLWQQLELRNNAVLSGLITKTAKLLSLREQKLEVHLKEDDDEEDQKDELLSGEEEEDDENLDEDDNELRQMEEGDDNDDSVEEEEEDEEDLFQEKVKRKQKPKRKSVVDDKFFKLDEMESFLEAEEAKEERKQKGKMLAKDDDGINYFTEDLGDEGEDSDEENSQSSL
ncbi:hypothetical protein DOY81_014293 [Sarcophaga bullata]|nr:hypothetical protein DOY81_014293 [Sarcophaga bullata]